MVHGIKKELNKKRTCLGDVGPVPVLFRLPWKILRKHWPSNYTSTPHRRCDAIRNNYNHSFLTFPYVLPTNSKNNSTLKDLCKEVTTENELIENDFTALNLMLWTPKKNKIKIVILSQCILRGNRNWIKVTLCSQEN